VDIYGIYELSFEGFLFKKSRDNGNESIIEKNDSFYWLGDSKPLRVLLFSVHSKQEIEGIKEAKGLSQLLSILNSLDLEHRLVPLNKLYLSIYNEEIPFNNFMRGINSNHVILDQNPNLFHFEYKLSKSIMKRFIKDNLLFDILDTKVHKAIALVQERSQDLLAQDKLMEEFFLKTVNKMVGIYNDYKKDLTIKTEQGFFVDLFKEMMKRVEQKLNGVLIAANKLFFVNLFLFRSPKKILEGLSQENISKVTLQYALDLTSNIDFFLKEIPTFEGFFRTIEELMRNLTRKLEEYTSRFNRGEEIKEEFENEIKIKSEDLGQILIEPNSPVIEGILKDLETYVSLMRENVDVKELKLFLEDGSLDSDRLNEVYKYFNLFGNRNIKAKVIDMKVFVE
jgi:hypothetical protein